MNNSKSSILFLFNQFEVLKSTVDKVEYFAKEFSFNSTLDSSGVSWLEFPLRADLQLRDMRISPLLFSDIISKLESHKVIGCDGILVVVLKKYAPDLAPFLSKITTNALLLPVFQLVRSPLLKLLIRTLWNPQIIALLVFYLFSVRGSNQCQIR